MAQQCIWAGAAGRTGNVHVSGSAYHVGSAGSFDRAAICDACSQTIGVFINGEWYVVLHNARGRLSYEKAPFAQFGDQRSADAGADSQTVGKKVRV